MSQILLEALIASIPLAAVALVAAWVVEQMGAGLKLRLLAWTAALLLPVLPAPAMLAVHALGIPSPLPAIQAALDPEPVVALVEPAAGALPAPLPTPIRKPGPQIPVAALLLGLAAAGAVVRLTQLALGLVRVARLKAASEAIADPELSQRLGRGVRLADTASPVLAGFVRPTILLPRRLLGGLSPDQAALVCAHERAHLAAGDHLSHLMEEAMVRVFWFNPFMTAVRERLSAAREEACDARALAGCDAARRRAYAHTLIAALKLAGPAEPVAAFTGFRRRGAQRRLKAILKPSGPGSRRAWAAAVLAGLGLTAAAGGISVAAAAEPPAPPAAPQDFELSAPPAPPASPAPPAPPAPRVHGYSVIIPDGADADEGPRADRKARPHIVTWGSNWRRREWDDLTPAEKAKVRAAVKQAQAATQQALAESHRALADSRQAVAEAKSRAAEANRMRGWGLTPEQSENIQRSVAEAMKLAELPPGPDDGRVMMRCKLGADGKAEDCVRAFAGPRRHFEFQHGPAGGPPAPPAPPAIPAPPAPPAWG